VSNKFKFGFVELSGVFFFFFVVALGLIEGFALAKQVLYHLSHTSSPFCSSYFGDGVL
jgi:hypothetical protein